MKKLFLAFLLFIFGFSFCKAQDSIVVMQDENPSKKFFISIDYGWSLPTGNFSANNKSPSIYASTVVGDAGTGPHGDLNCGYNFAVPFSALLEFGQDNNYSNYHIQQYLAGLSMGTNEAKHDLSFHLSWLVGFVTANYPYNTSNTSNFFSNGIYVGSNTTTTISLNNGKGVENYINAKLELNPIRILGVCLNIGYMFSTIKYSNSSSETSSTSTTSTQMYAQPVTMSLSAFEINFGLSYHFL